jgi:hypothetical protein
MKFLADGLGETLGGDELAGVKPLCGAFKVFYVDSAVGVDANPSQDSNKQHPFATFAYAVAACANGDMIVLEPTHNETLLAAVAVGVKITIVGIGTTSGKPSPVLIAGHANATITFSSPAMIRNVRFGASTATVAAAGVLLPVTATAFVGCWFEAGAFDTKPMVHLDLVNG